MDENIIKRLDKYYGYARSIAGSDGVDLLHDLLLRLPKNLDTSIPQRLDRYIYLSLSNEYHNKKSAFNKLYYPLKEEVEYFEGGYDIVQLNKILLELEIDGFEKEVMIFRDSYFGSNEYTVSKQENMTRYKVKRACDTIKQQIKERYVKHD